MVFLPSIWIPLDLLTAHECAFCADASHIVTVSHDRTIKLWTSNDDMKEQAMDVD